MKPADISTQLYWLLVLLLWGTLRLYIARSGIQIDRSSLEDNQWGFGQTLAALLLIAPIWSMVVEFTDHESLHPHLQESREYSNIDHSRSDSSGGPPHQVDPFIQPANQARNNILTPPFTTQHYYQTTSWLVCCFFMAYSSILIITITQFVSVLVDQSSLGAFWVTGYGALFLVVLGYPCAYYINILYGLWMDNWLGGPHVNSKLRKRRRYVFWLISVLIWGTNWYVFSESFNVRIAIGEYIGIAVTLTLIYLLGNIRAPRQAQS